MQRPNLPEPGIVLGLVEAWPPSLADWATLERRPASTSPARDARRNSGRSGRGKVAR
jgi:hypothetical protein